MDARKYLRKYIHHRKHIDKGNAEFTYLRHPVQAVLLAKIAYDWLPLGACVVFVVGYIGLCKFYGWCWDYFKGYDAEQEWGNARNPTIQCIKTGISDGKIKRFK